MVNDELMVEMKRANDILRAEPVCNCAAISRWPQHLSSRLPGPGWAGGCLAAVATPDYMHRAAKWLLTTNKNLPKFTPIFLILPQTLVVCQNWLASNLEKDILRKCQKCRRMEDNVGCSARLLEQCISNSLTNLHHNNIHVPRLLMHRISIKRLGNIFSKAQE